MTGGRAIILGPTGRNFAAGMSGGVAYVWDPEDKLLGNCNLETVALEPVEDTTDIDELKTLIARHRETTGSTVASQILDRWQAALKEFKKVMPVDYKRALQEQLRESQKSY